MFQLNIFEIWYNGKYMETMSITQEDFMKKHKIKSAEFFADLKKNISERGVLADKGKYKIFLLDQKRYIGVINVSQDTMFSIVNSQSSYNSNIIMKLDIAQVLAKYSGYKQPGKQKITLPKNIDSFCNILMHRFHLYYEKTSEVYRFIGDTGSKVKDAEAYLALMKIPYTVETKTKRWGWNGVIDQYDIIQIFVINIKDLEARFAKNDKN